MHELTDALAARADLAQQPLVGGGRRPIVGEIGDEPSRERSRCLFGTVCEGVGRRGRGGDPSLDVGGGPEQPPRIPAAVRIDRLVDLLVGQLWYVSAQELDGIGAGKRLDLNGSREERIGRRLEIERLRGGIACNHPRGTLERPQLIAQAAEHSMRDGGRDPVDHETDPSAQGGETVAEQVDELHEDRRLDDLPERPVGQRQRLELLQPPATRGLRLGEPLQARDEHAEQVRRGAGELSAHHHRFQRLGLAPQQPGHVIEQRAPSAARLPQHQQRLAIGNRPKNLARLCGPVYETSLISAGRCKRPGHQVSNISEKIMLITSIRML